MNVGQLELTVPEPEIHITERTSKKETLVMKRQLEIMMNRIKMLEIYNQKWYGDIIV